MRGETDTKSNLNVTAQPSGAAALLDESRTPHKKAKGGQHQADAGPGPPPSGGGLAANTGGGEEERRAEAAPATDPNRWNGHVSVGQMTGGDAG